MMVKTFFVVNDTNTYEKYILKEITNVVRDNNEYNILATLDGCDGIVSKPEKIEECNRINLIYKLYECDLYELTEHIVEYKTECIDEIHNYYKRCFCQLIHILLQLKDNSIVHRDLKLENVLVDNSGNLFVSDFEEARQMSKSTRDVITGTMCCMAPEIMHSGIYSFESDLWAVGVIMYEMWTGKLPWGVLAHARDIDELNIVYDVIRRTPFNKRVNIPMELLRIFELIFTPIDKRITIDELIKHEYFSDTDWDNLYKSEAQCKDLHSIIKQCGFTSKIYDSGLSPFASPLASPLASKRTKASPLASPVASKRTKPTRSKSSPVASPFASPFASPVASKRTEPTRSKASPFASPLASKRTKPPRFVY